MGAMISSYGILVGSMNGVGHCVKSGIDGRIILKWNLKKWCARCGLDSR
jgi:hypothetical protein